MSKILKNDLSQYNSDFQLRLVRAFMTEKTYFEDMYKIVNQNMFTDPNLRSYVGVLKDHFETYGYVPSFETMEILLRDKARSEIELDEYTALNDKIRTTTTEGVDEIKSIGMNFFKTQAWRKAARELLEIADSGSADAAEKCQRIANEVSIQGVHNDFGSTVFDNLGETLSDDYRTPIPTGIDKIDDTLEGGLGIGELGVIIGPTSFGKAQPLTSRVLTPSGMRRMGELMVGDKVIGADGLPHMITGVFPQGIRPIYKVSFSNGTSCECDIEHLWKVYDSSRNESAVITLGEIIERGILDKKGKPVFTVPLTEPVELDGLASLPEGFSIHDIATNIPSELMYSSIECRRQLLTLIMDEYGTLYSSGKAICASKNKFLMMDVAQLVRSLGGAAVYMPEEGYVEMAFNDYIRIFSSERKQKKMFYGIGNLANRIVSAEYVRDDDAKCIMIDSDDHLYITDGFNVTHNTSLTTAMASNAAEHGFKVLQIVFEDKVKQIQRKHIARLTNIEAKDLSKPANIDYVRSTLDEILAGEKGKAITENLRIVRFPSGEMTASDIKRYIVKISNSGFKPNLVIIDYFECIEPEKTLGNENEYNKEGRTMRKFEAMANELDIAIWVPTQGTKDSITTDIVTMDKSGGSVKKMQIAHIIMSIARPEDAIKNNKANVSILKNRAGKSGIHLVGVDFNNGTCRISTDNIEEIDSVFQERQKKMEEDRKVLNDFVRKHNLEKK